MNLFEPEDRKDIRVTYPELKKVSEFAPLSKYEMLFVYFYACKGAPKEFRTIEDDKKKIYKSAKAAFPERLQNTPQFERIKEGDFDEKIAIAIQRMQQFDMSARARAKAMVSSMFDNISMLVEVKTDDIESQFLNKEGETDWSKKKAYIDSCEKAAEMLPKLINQLETGFGVREEEEDYTSPIDQYHKNKMA